MAEGKNKPLGPGAFADLMPKFTRVSQISEILSGISGGEIRMVERLYCGNGVVFGLEGNQPIMLLTDYANNPLMAAPKDAANRLAEGNYFLPNQARADLEQRAVSNDGVVKIRLSRVKLEKDGPWHFVPFSCSQFADRREKTIEQYGEDTTALFDCLFGLEFYGIDGIAAKVLGHLSSLGYAGEVPSRIVIPSPAEIRGILGSRNKEKVYPRAARMDGIHHISLSAVHLDVEAWAYGELK